MIVKTMKQKLEKASQDNLDLPVSFIENILIAKEEVAQSKLEPYQFDVNENNCN